MVMIRFFIEEVSLFDAAAMALNMLASEMYHRLADDVDDEQLYDFNRPISVSVGLIIVTLLSFV